jgi:hypothetical protein
MIDVLERYRKEVNSSRVLAFDPTELLRDMAAEIEKLREEVAKTKVQK